MPAITTKHNNRTLFAVLCLFFLIPFLYTCVRTGLIDHIPNVDGLSIAGHMEWFDLIDETIQAFLIVPLYYLLNAVRYERSQLKGRIQVSFAGSLVLYSAMILVIYTYCHIAVTAMNGGNDPTTIRYLQLESVGFIFNFIPAFATVLFVTLGKSNYIAALTVCKTGATILSDLFLIRKFGIYGVAYSNMLVGLTVSIVCIYLGYIREFKSVTPIREFAWIKSYVAKGLSSGGQIVLDNLIYALIVCRMVNDVSEQGNYWAANNFIWGFMLIPVMALSEIIKRENNPSKIKNYIRTGAHITILWLILIPGYKLFLKYIMGIENPDQIFRIIMMLLPFYIIYIFSAIFSSLFIAAGKLHYNLAISLIVNIIYYGVMYAFYLTGLFQPGMTFICLLFGFGIVTNAACGFIIFKRRYQKLQAI